MILRRVIEHVKAQNWTAVALDFVIVVMGVFIGIQVSNWNDARQTAKADAVFLAQLEEDLAAMRASIADEAAFASELEAGAYYALRALEACEIDPERAEAIDLALSAYQTAPAALVFSGAYEEMTASGAFARIENAALKDAIAAIYAGLDRFNAIVGYIRRDHSKGQKLLGACVPVCLSNSVPVLIISVNLWLKNFA